VRHQTCTQSIRRGSIASIALMALKEKQAAKREKLRSSNFSVGTNETAGDSGRWRSPSPGDRDRGSGRIVITVPDDPSSTILQIYLSVHINTYYYITK
jgi:hypothetical protein